ncbi:hypothetical protein [Flagellimonas sp.]|uniref:hypothetical protein n=1 Tax=Flagellimonas sp. TaxID=2058762 RepID=UPI003AB55F91
MRLGELPWSEAMPSAVFLRDFEQLPVASPYDIDLLVDAVDQKALVGELTGLAKKLGLGVSSKLADDVCFVLIADLEAGAEGRVWAYFEVRSEVNYAANYCLKSERVERAKWHDLGIPVPSLSWQVMLSLLHSLRSGKTPKVNRDLLSGHPDLEQDVARLMIDEIGIEVKFGRNIYELDDGSAYVLHKVIKKKKNKFQPTKSLKSKFNSFAIKKFYAYPLGTEFVYTIHGPDGVGKTTTCSEISQVFSRLPLRFEGFHHITGWKHEKKFRERRDANSDNHERNVTRHHRFARRVYRILPRYCKELYVLVAGFHHYLGQLNSKIFQNWRTGNITLIDRYVYDMAAKNLISGIGPRYINLLFCRLMKKPKVSFVLRDEPENILARKQELTALEIVKYSKLMEHLVPRDRYYEIVVTGKTPREVSHAILTHILETCGPNLTYLLNEQTKAVGSREH